VPSTNSADEPESLAEVRLNEKKKKKKKILLVKKEKRFLKRALLVQGGQRNKLAS
jgi:hypothetical protein